MIRPMTQTDFEQFWPQFEAIIRAQHTYAFDANMSRQAAYKVWCELPFATFVLEQDGQILGSYYIKPNAQGPGSHVCNCGYMVSDFARGQGVARRLCEHSQHYAVEHGFKAMQFNSVVSTNQVAVALWQKLGFTTIGTIPRGYQHPEHGLVDCLIMYKWLV